MSDTENPIICLNYCLTCGRPPIPVTGIDLNPKTFAGISLKGMGVAADKTPEKSS